MNSKHILKLPIETEECVHIILSPRQLSPRQLSPRQLSKPILRRQTNKPKDWSPQSPIVFGLSPKIVSPKIVLSPK
jgi:hypothetical protein